VELTDILMENAGGEPMVDFTGATVTATFIGEDCVFSGTYWYSQEYRTWYQGTCGGTINSPEFPSLLLPATMIIGFLGAVLLIQRTREQ
jgi:hypothetical protein